MRGTLVAGLVVLLSGLAGCTQEGLTELPSDAELDFGDVQATATTGVIRGVVIDSAIRPIAGALVNLTTTARNATTSDDGAFAFDGLEPGTYFLEVTRFGFDSIQTSAEVLAGVDEPPIIKVQLAGVPSQQPYVDTLSFSGFLSLGAAIGLTSVGTTINPGLAESLGDASIWHGTFDQVPTWVQGELVWTHSQPAGGMLIWEMVKGNSNNFRGYRETAESPALAYWNTTVLQAEAENVTADGIDYRFFGGPHPMLAPGEVTPPADQCPPVPGLGYNPCRFGFGLTLQQRADAFVHNFYNFAPPEGWRFTNDGAPAVPPA